jgi:hypothetical protein
MKLVRVFFFFLIVCNLSFAQTKNRASLVGLRGIKIEVGDLTPDAEQAGLSRSVIQTDAELKLRIAGIRVIGEDEAPSPGMPSLYIRADCMKLKGASLFVYSLDVELTQNVVLSRP